MQGQLVHQGGWGLLTESQILVKPPTVVQQSQKKKPEVWQLVLMVGRSQR
uniref:Uncharacterized protein n=1 Tax=Arundo donax TaxID=35708 RepID=A0A0A9F2H0_ARUDO